MDKWLLINKKFSEYGLIFQKQEPMKDHEKFRNIKDKYINTFLKNLENKNRQKRKN